MTEHTTKPFLRPGKVVLLMLVGLVVYFVALLVLIPAGWVWHQASAYVPLPPQIKIQQVSGRLWEGAAGAVVNGMPFRIDWQLGWPSMTGLELPVRVGLQTRASHINGDLLLGWPGDVALNARGLVQVSEFEDLIRQSGGAMLEGEVAIERLEVNWADNRITSARGLGIWAGGTVTWPMGDSTQSAEFPPMEATLDNISGGISLVVAEQGGEGPAAQADILFDGMLEVQVFKRMVDLAGQRWSGAARPGDVVFRVRQPLLPGRMSGRGS